MDFEIMYNESEKVYKEQYSTGEYCHEQSFKWGFQEGYDCAVRLLKDSNLEKFVAKVKETHQGNEHEKDYLALVEFIKVRFNKNEIKEYFSKNTGYNLLKKFIYQIKKSLENIW